jgi:septum formation protein
VIVLASGSKIRASLLRAAHIPFDVVSPGVDEAAVKAELISATPGQVAAILAERKALAVSVQRPDDLVIGADQTLEFEDRLYDKAESLAEARERLLMLRGRTHHLNAGVVLARGGQVLWQDLVVSRLSMRDFSDGWLDGYLTRNPQVLASVGCYEMEGEGVQLFDRIDGDYFAILGLPLLGLLAALRREGALAV